MRSKKRINIGLLLLILLVIGATAYSIWHDRGRARQIEQGVAMMKTIQEEETRAIIFPEAAIVDESITPSEMDAQRATVKAALEKLYPQDPEHQAMRFKSLESALARQAQHGIFLRELTLDWQVEPQLSYENNLLKMDFMDIAGTLETYSHGSSDRNENYRLLSPLTCILALPDMTLVDQTMPIANRFLDIVLPGDQSFESEITWNSRF